MTSAKKLQQKYRIEFEIMALPKILSNLSNNHWKTAHFNKKKFKEMVWLEVANNLPSTPLTKARLTLIRHSSKEPDYDNLVVSFKGVIDGLKQAGVIADDKFSNIGRAEYQWQKAKMKQGKITVIVEEQL